MKIWLGALPAFVLAALPACSSPSTHPKSDCGYIFCQLGNNPLQARIHRTVEFSSPRGAAVSFAIRDLESGFDRAWRASEELHRPASNQKLLTLAAALRAGLAGRALETPLYLDEEGHLYWFGTGDPLLSSRDLTIYIEALRQQEGRPGGTLYIVDALFGPPHFGKGWMWDDEPSSFMPYVGALTLDGGTLKVEVDCTEDGDTPRVRIDPSAGSLELEVRVELGLEEMPPEEEERARSRVSISRELGPGGRRILVEGTLLQNDPVLRRISVPDPGLYAGEVLAEKLEEAGLTSGRLRVERAPRGDYRDRFRKLRPVAIVRRPFEEIFRAVGKESDNLAAECLLRLLAAEAVMLPELESEEFFRELPIGWSYLSAEAGLERIAELVRTLDHDEKDYRAVDGSGVSHYNLLSARLLVDLLETFHADAELWPVLHDALAHGQGPGTLARRFPELGPRVVAKTGTLSGVSALSGFVLDEDGETPRMAFSILVEGYVGSSREARKLQDALVRLVTLDRDGS